MESNNATSEIDDSAVRLRRVPFLRTLLFAIALLIPTATPADAAAAQTRTINGAVVALQLPNSSNMSAPWDGGDADCYGAYRLPCFKAMYLPGFGANNEQAMVWQDGGCAITTDGVSSCYGRNYASGDGRARARSLPRQTAVNYSQIQRVTPVAPSRTRVWYVDTDHEDFFPPENYLEFQARSTCGLIERIGQIDCWGGLVGGAAGERVTMGLGFVSLSSDGAVKEDGSLWIFTVNAPTWELGLTQVSRGIEGRAGLATDRIFVLPNSWNLSQSEGASAYPCGPEDGPSPSEWCWGGAGSDINPDTTVYYRGERGILCLKPAASDVTCARIIPTPMWQSLGAFSFDPVTQAAGSLGLTLEGQPVGADAYLSSSDGVLPSESFSLVEGSSASTAAECGRLLDAYVCALPDPVYDAGFISGSTGVVQVGPSRYAAVDFSSGNPTWTTMPDQPYPDVVDELVGNQVWWCARSETTATCAPATTPGSDQDVRTYLDRNADGRLDIGREIPLSCGVGFSCTFEPSTMQLTDSVLAMTGTLRRTPRTPITLVGSLRLSDGSAATGSLTWRSNDGLLTSAVDLSSNGSFVLPARTGAGTIQYLPYRRDGGTMMGQSCPKKGTSGIWGSGCTTGYGVVAFTGEFNNSIAGIDITLPTFAGQQRTHRLLFGDETTPMPGVSLLVAGNKEEIPTECTISSTTLGTMKACYSFDFSATAENNTYGPTTDESGYVSMYMPTGYDVDLAVNSTADDRIAWSDQQTSYADDGTAPDPWVFPGLVFASTPSTISMSRGGSAEVLSFVAVDGIDPVFGLGARLVPLSGQVKARCAEALEVTTDDLGSAEFDVCPGSTGRWRVVSTDGSFFPSAPFLISVPPMVTRIRVSGAALAVPFTQGVSSYAGQFTADRATFTVTLSTAARNAGAKIRAATCTRPSSGSRSCTVSVALDGTVEAYTFTLRR